MKPIKAFFVSLMLMLVGIATAQENPPAVPPLDPNYIVGPEDVLSITTRDQAEFSGDFLVRPDGKISFPIIGDIKVEGLTVAQVGETVRAKLLERELKRAEVSVNVRTMRAHRIYVMGQVGTPGMLDWKPNWRLTELISAAGGLSGLPERLTALIWRRGEPAKKVVLKDIFVDAKDDANIEVKPGDVINIHSKPTIRVTVTGKAQKQGLIDIFEGDGAAEAIAGMGGAMPDGALSQAKIIRGGQEIPVDLHKVIMLGQSGLNVPLQDGDILNIPEHKKKVAVIGLVSKAGPVEIPDGRGLTLAEAVGQAGGVIREAKTDTVMLSRRTQDGNFESKPYNLKDILAGKKNVTDPVLQDGDVIFVAQSGKPNGGTIGQILGLILTGGGLFGRLGF